MMATRSHHAAEVVEEVTPIITKQPMSGRYQGLLRGGQITSDGDDRNQHWEHGPQPVQPVQSHLSPHHGLELLPSS